MTGHTIDQTLLTQIDTIRQQLILASALPSVDLPRCIALIQRLDLLTVQLHSGPVDPSTAQQTLAEINAEIPNLQAQTPNPNFALLRETLPPQPRAQAELQNQARLVEHLLNQPNAAEPAQRALLDYAQTLRHHTPTAEHTHINALQLRLSEQMAARAANPSPFLQTRIVSASDITSLQRAVSSSAPLGSLDPNQPAIESQGNIQSDLQSLAQRYLDANTLNALNNEELVLAHIRTDHQGLIRKVELHKVHQTSRTAPPASTPAQTVAPTVTPTPATTPNANTPSDPDAARRFILDQQNQLALSQSAAQSAQTDFADAQHQLAALEAQANAAQQQQIAASEAQANQQTAQNLALATHDAASQALQQQSDQLAKLTRSLVQVLYSQAQQSSDEHRETLLNQARNIDQWLASSPDLQNANPSSINRVASSIQNFVQQIIAVAPPSIGDQLSKITAQASATQAQSAQAADTLSWSPLASLSPSQSPQTISDERLRAARALAETHANRFQTTRYLALSQEDRLLASERDLSSTNPNLPRTSPKSPLAIPAAPSFPASSTPGSLNIAPINAAASSHLQRLQGLSAAHSAPSIDLHSDTAGLDLTPSSRRAVLSGDNNLAAMTADLMHRAMQHAFLQLGDVNHEAALFAASAGRLSATHSGQRDLGLNAKNPLFKRKIGVAQDGKIGQVYLPALREVSDLAPASPNAAPQSSNRADIGELVSARAEAHALQSRQNLLLSSIERLMGGVTPDAPTTSVLKQANSSTAKTQQALSHLERLSQSPGASKTSDPAALERQELAKELRSEAQSVPLDAASKLNPILSDIGVDMSGIRLYNGPRAARLADAMGAHAFTMGKHIFGRIDLATVEGLSLFAHEATHTTHYDAPTSVTQKEQEAEAVEHKAVQALSEGRFQLALENPTHRKNDGALRSAGARSLLESAAPNANDMMSALSAGIDTSHAVVARIGEFIMKRMKREMGRDA